MRAKYVTKALLREFLTERCSTETIAGKSVPGATGRFRPDFRIDAVRLVVEFDGWRHDQQTSVILPDERKDKELRKLGFEAICVPHFAQLDSARIAALFGRHFSDKPAFNNYPHGFVDEKALLPVDFCELGIEKLLSDLERLSTLRNLILVSLSAAERRLGDWCLVWPLLLRERYHRIGTST